MPYADGVWQNEDGCGPEFPVGDFLDPIEVAHWTDPSLVNIYSTPIVGDLDRDGRVDLTSLFLGPSRDDHRLFSVDGATGTLHFSVPFPSQPGSSLAVADLDGDGEPEIVAIMAPQTVVVLDNKGRPLARSAVRYASPGYDDSSGPTIADIDGRSPPEIIVGLQVSRYHKGEPDLEVLWTKDAETSYSTRGDSTLVADMDGDGSMELVLGNRVYDALSGRDETPGRLASLGRMNQAYAAIADFNGDGKPDLALVLHLFGGVHKVAVYDYAGDSFLVAPFTDFSQESEFSGPPTIADCNGDGRPEIVVASEKVVAVFDPACLGVQPPPSCPKDGSGWLWRHPYEENSEGTTATAFDFNGDGAAEVIVRDRCRLRVFNGPDGRLLVSKSMTSFTAMEAGAVAADVDGDGHAELVVSSDSDGSAQNTCSLMNDPETGTPWTGFTSGLFVLKDPLDRWMPAASVWNEFDYHVTNVGPSLAIPVPEPPSWKGNNTFRAQAPGVGPSRLPDATAGTRPEIEISSSDCSQSWTLRARVCNRGADALAGGLPGTFYAADPRPARPKPLCTVRTTSSLSPGQCEVVGCDFRDPPAPPIDLWFRVNDDGVGLFGRVAECNRGNDLLVLRGARCTPIR